AVALTLVACACSPEPGPEPRLACGAIITWDGGWSERDRYTRDGDGHVVLEEHFGGNGTLDQRITRTYQGGVVRIERFEEPDDPRWDYTVTWQWDGDDLVARTADYDDDTFGWDHQETLAWTDRGYDIVSAAQSNSLVGGTQHVNGRAEYLGDDEH